MFRAARTRLAIPPPPGIFYLPPANQQDFTKATSYRSWQQLVRDNYTNAIWGPSDDPKDPQYYSPTGIAYRLPDARALADGLYASYGVSNLQYRSTEDLVTMATQHNLTPVEAKISWTGFPKNLQGKPDKYKAAEKPGYWNAPKARPQDEYCEWFSKRDSSGKIVSVQITCESPEYWQHLFEQEPETCLALYKQYISKDVTLDSLVDSRGQYDLYNKWNTVAGAMHLNCPPNSLFAELYIAAEAGTMWGKNGAPKTDPQDLVNCAEYGVNTRASDPHIGASVNTLVQQGMVVSIQRPVGLYLDKLKLNGWQNNQRKLFAPDQLDKIVTYQRGSDGRNLRINIEIPAGWGYVLGDCYIAGQNIAWAGQVVESAATIFLTGLAIDGADFVKPDAKQRAVVPCKDAWTQKPPTVGPQPVVVPWYPPQMRNRAAPRHSPQRQ